jgi:hypothetical protein
MLPGVSEVVLCHLIGALAPSATYSLNRGSNTQLLNHSEPNQVVRTPVPWKNLIIRGMAARATR